MKKLELKYRRWFRNLTNEVSVPGNWSEMSPGQFRSAARAYIEDVSEDQFVGEFYSLPVRVVAQMSQFQKYILTDMLQFALNPDGRTNSFFLQEIPGTRLKAPGAKLKGVTIEHFAIFDTYFFEMVADNTDEALDRFVASLYLKPGERITGVNMGKRIRYVSKRIDKPTKYAIFLNYIFVRRWLSKVYPFLFQSDDDVQESSGRIPKKINKKILPDWNSIIEGVVGEDILHYDNYTQLPCIQFFKSVNYKIKKYNVK